MDFCRFDHERLKNDPTLVDACLDALASAMARLASTTGDVYLKKGRMGRVHADDALEPSSRCAACGTHLPKITILCARCKASGVELCEGRPFIALAWNGSHPAHQLTNDKMREFADIEARHSLAFSALLLSGKIERIGRACIDYGYPAVNFDAMFAVTELEAWRRGVQLQETYLPSVGEDTEKAIRSMATEWVNDLDIEVCAYHSVSTVVQDPETRLRLRRVKRQLAELLSSRAALFEDPDESLRLSPRVLEAITKSEVLTAELPARAAVVQDLERMRRLLGMLTDNTDNTNNTDNTKVDADLAELLDPKLAPPELALHTVRRTHLDALSFFLKARSRSGVERWVNTHPPTTRALRDAIEAAIAALNTWKLPKSGFVRTLRAIPPSVPPSVPPFTQPSPDPPPDPNKPTRPPWVPSCSWHWEFSPAVTRRTGLCNVGERIVRLTSCIWQLLGGGSLPRGIVEASVARQIGAMHRIRALIACEELNQMAQVFHLVKDFERGQEQLINNGPIVEDSIAEAISHLARFSQVEIATTVAFFLPARKGNIAALTASRIVSMPDRRYRDFLQYVLPIVLQHLACRREDLRVNLEHRLNPLAELLRSVAAIREWEEEGRRAVDLKIPVVQTKGEARRVMEQLSKQVAWIRLSRLENKWTFTLRASQLHKLLASTVEANSTALSLG